MVVVVLRGTAVVVVVRGIDDVDEASDRWSWPPEQAVTDAASNTTAVACLFARRPITPTVIAIRSDAMSAFLDDEQRAVLDAAVDRLIPPAGEHPGGAALGVADYIDTLLGAFSFDPPRIFAGGPFSGRAGGEPGFERFIPLTPHQEKAWRQRIEGWQAEYREGLDALGSDFATRPPAEQDARLDGAPRFKALLYEHACEGAYGAPEYGGNRDLAGWRAIQFPGDVQPRGYTDEEVSGAE